MRKIRMEVAAFALAAGTLCATGGAPAYANICDQLAARIAELANEENQYRGWLTISEARRDPTNDPASVRRAQNQGLQRAMARRASAERQYAKKNCGEYRAQRDAEAAATGAALGAIGFGIMSGAMGGGYRGGYRSGSSSGRSGYSSGGSYRRY